MSGGELSGYRVWVDQTECTGDGSCYTNCPNVFVDDGTGIAFVREGKKVFDGSSADRPDGPMGVARIAMQDLEIVIAEAEECPGDCIHIEPADAPM